MVSPLLPCFMACGVHFFSLYQQREQYISSNRKVRIIWLQPSKKAMRVETSLAFLNLFAFYMLPVYAKVVLWLANMKIVLLYLCRYSETLRRTIGNEIIQLYYNATLSKLTRILDELEGIDTISCNIGKINIVLVESARTDLFLERIHAGTLIYGWEKWRCTDLKKAIKSIYARVTGATAKVSSLDIEVVYVDPLSLFHHFDLEMKVESIENEFASKRQLDILEAGTLDQITPLSFNFSGDIFEKMNGQDFPYFCPNCSMSMDAYWIFHRPSYTPTSKEA